MLIVSRRKLDTFNGPLCLTIDRNSTKQVSFRRFLDVYTDKNLAWNILISKYLKRSCLWHSGISRRGRSFVPFETLLCIYYALVQPHSSSYGGIAINLSQLNYKNYRIALRVFWPLLPKMPTLMIFFVRLESGKNLIFDENSEKKQRTINYLMVLPLIIWN